MSKSVKIFRMFLIISSISIILNLAMLYWHPTHIPLSSFSAVALLLISYVTQEYVLIPICYIIPILLIFTSISIKKQKKVLPIICVVYYVIDLFLVFSSFYGLLIDDNYFDLCIFIQLLFDIYCVVMLLIYIIKNSNILKK